MQSSRNWRFSPTVWIALLGSRAKTLHEPEVPDAVGVVARAASRS
jgi:hypothetical protein